MIRIGFTLIGGGVGTGLHNYLLNLIRQLCAYEGHRVTPVLLFGTDAAAADTAPFLTIAGAEVVFTPAMDSSRKTAALARAILIGADSAQRRVLNDQRIDLMFENAQFFGWRVGRPVVAWIPDFQHRHLRHMFTSRGYWRRELGFLTQMAAGRTIMVSSQDALSDCERFYPQTTGRTHAVRFAVPSGRELTHEQARRTADGYGLPPVFFYMPNQFSKHKNHWLVLDALALLRERGVEVVAVSSGKQLDERHPDYFPAVKARLEALGLQQQLRLLGVIPYVDVGALMQASVAVVNPSLFEGWSTPVEEARALGVPMVLSDLGVHREQAGTAAVYFDRHSAASLADVLQGFEPLSAQERSARQVSARLDSDCRVRSFAAEFAELACNCVAQGRLRT